VSNECFTLPPCWCHMDPPHSYSEILFGLGWEWQWLHLFLHQQWQECGCGGDNNNNWPYLASWKIVDDYCEILLLANEDKPDDIAGRLEYNIFVPCCSNQTVPIILEQAAPRCMSRKHLNYQDTPWWSMVRSNYACLNYKEQILWFLHSCCCKVHPCSSSRSKIQASNSQGRKLAAMHPAIGAGANAWCLVTSNNNLPRIFIVLLYYEMGNKEGKDIKFAWSCFYLSAILSVKLPPCSYWKQAHGTCSKEGKVGDVGRQNRW
jgi:hypothetical protein